MRPSEALAVLLLAGLQHAAAQTANSRTVFMGHKVTVTVPELEPNGMDPKSPATVCVDMQPQPLCYTAPDGFGRDPEARVVQVNKETSALFFQVSSGGASGFQIHFSLFRVGKDQKLEDLFLANNKAVSNQSQNAFWTDPEISEAKIFVTADYVWGPDEGHYSPHRFIVSAYLLRKTDLLADPFYYLEDRFMTARKYDLGKPESSNVLRSEMRGILLRLSRVKPKPGNPAGIR